MVSLFSQIAGLSSGRSSGLYFVVLGLDVAEVVPRGLRRARAASAGRASSSPSTLAPASTPLWAMGVAMAMAFAQLCPGPAGNVRRVAQRDGRHVPRDVADVVGAAAASCSFGGIDSRPRSGCTFVASPISSAPSARAAAALASVWSASLHCGRPTALMLAYIASAIGLLKCRGQAEPSTREVQVGVGHHRRAPAAIVSPMSHSSLMCVVVGLAEVVPDRGVGRHDVGLVAAVGDDVVRALLQAQVLAAEVPARRPSARRRRARCGRATVRRRRARSRP